MTTQVNIVSSTSVDLHNEFPVEVEEEEAQTFSFENNMVTQVNSISSTSVDLNNRNRLEEEERARAYQEARETDYSEGEEEEFIDIFDYTREKMRRFQQQQIDNRTQHRSNMFDGFALIIRERRSVE